MAYSRLYPRSEPLVIFSIALITKDTKLVLTQFYQQNNPKVQKEIRQMNSSKRK